MANTPLSASTEQKPTSPANSQQSQGNPQQGNQQQNQGNPQQNQGGNKPSTDKPASEQQK